MAVLSDPAALFTHLVAWFQTMKRRLFTRYDRVPVMVVSSGPSRRPLVDILLDPPKLELIEALEDSQVLSEVYIGPPGLELNYIPCTGEGCLICRKLLGLDEPPDPYDVA